MRGSISNDGFSEAFTQREEDRPQAGSRGGGRLQHWCFATLKLSGIVPGVRESECRLEESEAIRP